MDIITLYIILPLLLGWLMDLSLGDPEHLPHPIVWFGKLITWGDKRLNQQSNRLIKGGLYSTFLILFVFALTWGILLLANRIHPLLAITINTLGIFFFLAGKTLRREVKMVFDAVDQSVEDGRKQLSRIVGRDTSQLSPQQIRIGALETLAENLSDGVIAPLFWFLIFGLPGMAAYKMINTLDSMIAYKNDKYKSFVYCSNSKPEGTKTVSMTWMIPFDASISVEVIIESFTIGSPDKSKVNSSPFTVSAVIPSVKSLAITFPERT